MSELIFRRLAGALLEHPQASAAWAAFDLNVPPFSGAWVTADFLGGWTCCVEQGHYGHRARKATWLYAHAVDLPSLRWGRSAGRARVDAGCRSAEERRMFMRPPPDMTAEWRERRRKWLARYAFETGKELLCAERMGRNERSATPEPFRDLLLSIAATARPAMKAAAGGAR